MDTPSASVHFDGISELFRNAQEEGRNFLFEYEVYRLLHLSGAETPPRCLMLPCGARPSAEELMALPGEKLVLKIVSPAIVHKSDVGGVRIVEKEPQTVISAMRRMLYEVPENYAQWIEKNREASPPEYGGLSGEALETAIRGDLRGVLLVRFMPPDSGAFGNELIVGLRNSREFGTIISAGLGGTDTELYASRFRKGQAIIAASCELTDGETFFARFRKTIAYKKLAGLTRGQRRIVTDEQLAECFHSFIEMGRAYSPVNPDAEFVIEELEINPFAVTDYRMVPLDGLCRFRAPRPRANPRPIRKIHKLLHPGTIGIIGVSAKRKNFGGVILENILAEGYPRENIRIVRKEPEASGGVRCVPSLRELPEKLDLFVVAVGAEQLPQLVEEVIERDAAEAVMLIPGNMGETGESRERAARVAAAISGAHAGKDGGPVFLGANCMGVVSRPGGYDTWFIPGEKLPRDRRAGFHRAALISQSGAFMLHRGSQLPEMSPAYRISMGNQTDLTLGDMIRYFRDSPEVDVIAVYAEGFRDLDGLEFCGGVREATLAGKEVIFYKAGRTPEGKSATRGHTASLAGDYMVCESCVRQAGAMVAGSFTEFQDLFLLAGRFSGRPIRGNRLAVASGAGFEAVGMADSIHSDEYRMRLAAYSRKTEEGLKEILKAKRLDALVNVGNPLDLNPAADDETHALVADLLLGDEGVDALIMGLDPLSPSTRTLRDSPSGEFSLDAGNGILALLPGVAAKHATPLVGVVDGGRLFDPLRDALNAAGIPVFPVCDRAVAAMSLYIEGRLRADALRRREGAV